MMSHHHLTVSIIILLSFKIKVYGQESIISTCGKRLVLHNALVVSGFETKEGDWPWHAAIFHLSSDNIKYKCGGTLLNTNSVLTAAHCVFENNRQIISERLTVQLGTHDIRVFGTNTQYFGVFSVIPHPSYNTSELSNDIAIIRLSTEATFNNYVQPICLPNKVKISKITGKRGIVIGWGLTEKNELSHILRKAVMPVVSVLTCLMSNRGVFGSYLSENNFCAGFRNGTSVCNGDSGGSLTIEEHGTYHIRGIVSLTSSRDDNTQICNPNEFVLFTDVARYLDWIGEVIPEIGTLNENRIEIPNEEAENDVACKNGGSCLVPTDLPDNIKVYYKADETKELSKGSYANPYSAVIYKCTSDYTLSGSETNYCLESRWVKEHAECRENTTNKCSAITGVTITASCEIFGDLISCSQLLRPQTIAKINCAVGYRKPNETVVDVLNCKEGGEWDHPVFSCEQICGETQYLNVPWHVGIYRNTDKDVFRQICGGTIINANVVVSAANCFWNPLEDRFYEPEDYKIGAGKNYRELSVVEPIEPQIVDILQIVHPPEYEDYSAYYADDVALLVLVNPLRFNAYIRPICIETNLTYDEKIVPNGLSGHVVGWGLETPSGKSSLALKYIEVSAIERNACNGSLTIDFRSFLTPDKFCVGRSSGQSIICQGDTGAGFFYSKIVNAKKLSFLRGIASIGASKGGSCDPDVYVLFTNIQSHIDFIKHNANQNRPK